LMAVLNMLFYGPLHILISVFGRNFIYIEYSKYNFTYIYYGQSVNLTTIIIIDGFFTLIYFWRV